MKKVANLNSITYAIYKYLKKKENNYRKHLSSAQILPKIKLVLRIKYDVIIEDNKKAQQAHSRFEIRNTRFEIRDSNFEIQHHSSLCKTCFFLFEIVYLIDMLNYDKLDR